MGRVKTFPNLLTLIRIVLIPFIVVLIVKRMFQFALFLFLISSLTDFFDGLLARKTNTVTTLGMLIDPVADKLLTSSTLIALACVKLCDPYSVVAIVGREEAVTGMRAVAASRGIVVPASVGGKLKTFLITVSVVLLLSGFSIWGEIFLVASAFVAVFTGLYYFYEILRVLKEEDFDT